MYELWEIVKGMIPGLIAAIPTLTALIVATVKIIRAIKDNKNINNKLDGLIDIISLDYQSRKSVTPLEKQAMLDLSQKIKDGGRIDGVVVATETKKLVEKLAETVENMKSKPVHQPTVELKEDLPEGFISPDTLA